MSNIIIINLQITIAFFLYWYAFRTYVLEKLSGLSIGKAIAPLLLIHVLRIAGMSMLGEAQIDASMPIFAIQQIAYGDFAAAITAFLASVLWNRSSSLAKPATWLFSIIGLGDIANNLRVVVEIDFLNHYIGSTWMVLVYLAPALIITHCYILYRLFKPNPVLPVT
jgi:hypothetical protein